MKLLISTGSFTKFKLSLHQIFKISKEIGFDGVELFLGHPDDIKKINPYYVKKIAEEFNLPVYNLHFPPYERYLLKYIFSPESTAKRVIVESFKIAQILGVENFILHPLPTIYQYDLFKRRMKNILDLLPKDNIKISLEIMPSVKFGPLVFLPHILRYPEDFNSFCRENEIYLTLDITHCKNISLSPEEVFLKCKEMVVNIHLSDFEGKNQHLPIGWGKIDFKKFFEILKENNYNNFVTLELVSEYFNSPEVIRESFKICKQYIK